MEGDQQSPTTRADGGPALSRGQAVPKDPWGYAVRDSTRAPWGAALRALGFAEDPVVACVDLLVGEDLNPLQGKSVEDECSWYVASCTFPDSLSATFQKHEFFVDMTCEGCSNAVTRVLHKLGGESVLGV